MQKFQMNQDISLHFRFHIHGAMHSTAVLVYTGELPLTLAQVDTFLDP